jgi:small subunit ribosomal protein S5
MPITPQTTPTGDRGRKGARGDGRRSGGREPRRNMDIPEGFEQRILDIARVTRVTAGGKRMRFRACVAIGNGKGTVGIGVAKGADVATAISKATKRSTKELVSVPLENETIPHDIEVKFKAAKLLCKPAPKGTGIIAGGVVRTILELAGTPNIVAKMLGSSNKVTNAKAAIGALSQLRGR